MLDAIGSVFNFIAQHPVWYVLVTGHITTVSVTVYLHRCQTHRSVTLAPLVQHFFRLWLWLRTGINTPEWTSIHIKHHTLADKEGDPHSPQIFGILRILFLGVWYYRKETLNSETIRDFAPKTLPKDWIEKYVYASYKSAGLFILLGVECLIFGWWGLVVWIIQMLWIPWFAAGILNGLGHYWGYRNFETKDASRNIYIFAWVPTLFFVFTGGEEYHNNHHRKVNSPKFSARWWEFDVSWLYLKVLEFLRLAELAPTRVK